MKDENDILNKCKNGYFYIMKTLATDNIDYILIQHWSVLKVDFFDFDIYGINALNLFDVFSYSNITFNKAVLLLNRCIESVYKYRNIYVKSYKEIDDYINKKMYEEGFDFICRKS